MTMLARIILLLCVLPSLDAYAAGVDDSYTLPGGQQQICVGAGCDLESTAARFVGTGGVNDANCGLTHADRCLTTAGLSTPLAAGTDVYLLAGSDNGQRQLVINWSGTSADRVIVGCYYLDGSSPTSCDSGSGAGAQANPLIRGTYVDSCRTGARPLSQGGPAATCEYNSASAVPTSESSGLIVATAQSYITIQDLRVEDSAGVGILIDESNTTPSYAIVQRNDVTRTARNGIRIFNAAAGGNGIIRENTVTLAALSWVDGLTSGSNWGQSISVRGNQTVGAERNSGALIEGNVITNSAGESITANRINNVTIRGNVTGNSRRIQYYADNSSNTIFEHNIAAGGGYSNNGYSEDAGHCFSVAVEDYTNASNSTGVIIRNNICGNSQRGITLLMDTASRTAGRLIGFLAYGNTFAVYNASANFLDSGGVPVANIDYIEVANNLFTGSAACSWSNYGVDDDIQYNAWSATPVANCYGTNSVTGSTGITLETWTSSNLPTVADMTPGALVLNAGSARTAAILDIASYARWRNHASDLCSPSEANWEAAMAVDFSCNARGTPPTPGAVEP